METQGSGCVNLSAASIRRLHCVDALVFQLHDGAASVKTGTRGRCMDFLVSFVAKPPPRAQNWNCHHFAGQNSKQRSSGTADELFDGPDGRHAYTSIWRTLASRIQKTKSNPFTVQDRSSRLAQHSNQQSGSSPYTAFSALLLGRLFLVQKCSEVMVSQLQYLYQFLPLK